MARILIVDDTPEIRRMLTSRLKATHEIVGELSDGYAAASEVEETQPDVVIMDFKMPTVSGIHATREVKTLFPHVVIVGFTSSEEDVRRRMVQAGADAVFAKEDVVGLAEFVDALRAGS